MMIVVQQLVPVGLDTLGRFLERIRGRPVQTRRHGPWRAQYLRILNGRLPDKIFAVPPNPLDDPHGVAVEVAVLAEPGIVYEISHVDDEHIALPSPHRVAVMGWVRSGAMRTAVGGDDAVRVAGDVLIEKDHFVRQLHHFARRTDAWHSGL